MVAFALMFEKKLRADDWSIVAVVAAACVVVAATVSSTGAVPNVVAKDAKESLIAAVCSTNFSSSVFSTTTGAVGITPPAMSIHVSLTNDQY